MEQDLLILLSTIASIMAGISLFKAHHNGKIQHKLLQQLTEMRSRMAEILWQEKSPYARYNYLFNNAREHQFDIEIVNTLDMPITLTDLTAYPQGEKLSYSEISFPQQKNDKTGLAQTNRVNYSDKIALERIKTSLDTELAPNQRIILKYTLKFKDGVFAGKKPEIFVCYQSDSHTEIKELHISQLESFNVKQISSKPQKNFRVAGINLAAL